jgi:N-acetyl-gamma-glutamyl-phosphate reductase
MKRVAVLGASGYAGRELLRLLRGHPRFAAPLAMSARRDSGAEAAASPFESSVAPLDLEQLRDVDGVFVCAPHGAAAELAAEAFARGAAVVDLSADFRLRDSARYAATYGRPHPAPAMLEHAVYGLTEHARSRVRTARLVANPGCYPTSILLPLLPLVDAALLDAGAPVVADAKSGISGAGKAPTERTHYGSVHENCQAYDVGTHRHGAEIAQEVPALRVVFVPHLLPAFRGMLTTLYLRPRDGVGADAIRSCLAEAYAHEPFVKVYVNGLPHLHAVQHTNFCALGVAAAGELVVIVSALDNLVKGAAGQALQNMNLMLGLPETAGLG